VELVTGTIAIGCGTALPSKILDNAELAARLDVAEEWIFQRTGIRSRRIAGRHETSSTLATEAARAALTRAGIAAEDLDLIIVATMTPDRQIPATASLVQANIGANRAGAFDLNAGCAGFLYGLAQADAHISSGACERVLVCGADVLSRVIDYTDPGTSILFGDGAGAIVLQRTETNGGPSGFFLRSDGSQPELLEIPPEEGLVRMKGREVYRRAVEEMSASLAHVLEMSHLVPGDLDLVVVHQANARIIEAVIARLKLDPALVMMNIESVGNTSAASIPIALSDAAEGGRLHPDTLVAVAAFGAGFAWGTGLLRWGAASEPPARGSELPALVGTNAQLVELA
jgi:3-oxoacyl-[acyl-carrier-protein] synthase III